MTDGPAIPCVIYAAKSTPDTRGSIPAQLAECRAAIQADPRRLLVAEYSDEAFSAYRRDRGPGLVDATEHAEDLAHEYGVAELWAQHSDRIARGDGRSARHTVEVALWALKADVRVRTLQDPDTFRDLLYAVVTGQRNNEDSKRKAVASQAGMRRAVARGEWVYQAPDGYKVVRELHSDGRITRRMEIDPDRREVIELIFRLALRGRTCGQIAATLNRRGALTKPAKEGHRPRPFDMCRVYETLRSPRYAAIATYRGEVLARGCWPAYITERQHERILARITRLRASTQRGIREEYLLIGLGRCGECGRKLRAQGGRPRDDANRARRYVCGSHATDRGPPQCPARPLHAHTIEAMLIANLAVLLRGPGQSLERADGISRPDHRTSYAALARHCEESQRLARERADIARMRHWAERELDGRTPETREETIELRRLVGAWFSEITVKADVQHVHFTATRRGAGAPGVPVRVRISRIEWTRRMVPGRRAVLHGTWERAEIVGALQAWHDRHGKSPRHVDWRHAAPDHPNGDAVNAQFGPWNAALKAAGLELVSPPPHYEWRAPEILGALRRWTSLYGRPPYSMEWAVARPGYPAASTVRARFGHWDDALYAAGLTPLRPASQRRKAWSRADVQAALRAWTEREGHLPHSLDWARAGPDRPAAGTVYRAFGRWGAALEAAGLQPNPIPRGRYNPWHDKQIIAAIRHWVHAHDSLPSPAAWAAPPEGYPNRTTVYRHFGSWKAALQAAGVG